jgi:hypothetical protein
MTIAGAISASPAMMTNDNAKIVERTPLFAADGILALRMAMTPRLQRRETLCSKVRGANLYHPAVGKCCTGGSANRLAKSFALAMPHSQTSGSAPSFSTGDSDCHEFFRPGQLSANRRRLPRAWSLPAANFGMGDLQGGSTWFAYLTKGCTCFMRAPVFMGYNRSATPILFGLPSDSLACRVLHLEPMRRAARAVTASPCASRRCLRARVCRGSKLLNFNTA